MRADRWLACACFVLTACQGPPPASAEEALAFERVDLPLAQVHGRLWRAGPERRFEGTTEQEQATVAEVVKDLLATSRAGQQPSRAAIDRAAVADLRVELWTVAEQRYAALVERGPEIRGLGAYVIRIERAAPGRETLLQAPHAMFDLHTGAIAEALFFAPGAGPRARALFTNTRQRYAGPGGEEPPLAHLSLDVCHNAEHPFTRATAALLQADPTLRVVQLHGFADEPPVPPDAPDVIVSAGTKHHAPAHIVKIRDALRGSGWRAAAYPIDVRRLGATANVQGRILRRFHTADFVHVELSAPMRDRLRADPVARARLASAVFLAPSAP